MKRMAGILLARLQVCVVCISDVIQANYPYIFSHTPPILYCNHFIYKATARTVVNDPVKHTHSRRIREDVRFYRDFLLPRFKLYCDELGWEMPRVGAFEIEEEDLQREGMSWIDDNTQQRNQQQSGGSDGSYHSSSSNRARNISSSPSSISSKESRLRRKLKRIIRRTESEEDRNAARERASQRLKPKPFSQSKVHRLNELKAAKLRAEERKAGMSSGESVSSFHSMESFQDLGAKDEVRHSMVIFTFAFAIYMTLLLLLRRGDMLEAVESIIQFGSASLDLFMILLQSLCLWTLLNGVLIYAFERVDFGQKELVTNMFYGKHYVTTEIKRLTLLASVAVAVISCGYGVAAKSFHWIFCLQSDGDHTDIRQPRVDLRRLLPWRSESNESAGSERAGVSYAFDAIRTSCWHIVTALGWVTSKLQMNSAPKGYVNLWEQLVTVLVIKGSRNLWQHHTLLLVSCSSLLPASQAANKHSNYSAKTTEISKSVI